MLWICTITTSTTGRRCGIGPQDPDPPPAAAPVSPHSQRTNCPWLFSRTVGEVLRLLPKQNNYIVRNELLTSSLLHRSDQLEVTVGRLLS